MNKKKHIWQEYLAASIVGLLLIALAPLLASIYVLYVAYGIGLFVIWNLMHGRHGRRFLVVFSSSPKWESFFEDKVMPLLGTNAVVVNTTENPKWKGSKRIERRAHKHWGGCREHTPIVLFFPQLGRVKVLRFYKTLTQRDGCAKLDEQLSKLAALAKSS